MLIPRLVWPLKRLYTWIWRDLVGTREPFTRIIRRNQHKFRLPITIVMIALLTLLYLWQPTVGAVVSGLFGVLWGHFFWAVYSEAS